ncbi:MAG: regulatory protein TetR [Labilithrix sp.]|nr:regulatory protein TetR [Labilithrix sp.]
MARWEPNAVGRLQAAAMQLYRDPGYDKVTVAEIAARAGLTPRTFFRYFPDKREVLFYATEEVAALVGGGILAAPDGTPAMEAVAEGLARLARLSDEDPVHAGYARLRHTVVQANPELRERELGKAASLASAMTASLERRGVDASAARLAAEAGLAAFKVGFQQWADDPAPRPMEAHLRDAARSLEDLVRGSVVLGQAAAKAKKKVGKKATPGASRKTTRAKRPPR